MPGSDLLNAEAAASLLHIGRNAVYALAKSGDLPSYRLGRKLLFDPADLEAYRQRQRTGNEGGASGDSEPAAANAATAGSTRAANPAGRLAESLAVIAKDGREGDGAFRIAGLGTPCDLIVDRLEQQGHRSRRVAAPSYHGLVALYEGAVDAVVTHLYDQRSNSYNVPYVQRLAPGLPLVVFRLMRRQAGLLVAPGNPQGISSWGALLREGLRVANQPLGCAARILLDEKLLAMEADPSRIVGYRQPFPTVLAAAEAVAGGVADAAVADEAAASQVGGVDFVPLQQEWVDIAVAKRDGDRRLARLVRTMLGDAVFKREYARIVHGDTSALGSIVYEC